MKLRKRVLIPAILILLLSGATWWIMTPSHGLFAPSTPKTTDYKAVHEAALAGDTKKLETLLAADPNAITIGDSNGDTALHLAAFHRKLPAVQLLLKRNANVDARNHVGMTALHLAARIGDVQIVKALLDYTADPNVRDSGGWTPLKWAVSKHNDLVADTLRAHGARD